MDMTSAYRYMECITESYCGLGPNVSSALSMFMTRNGCSTADMVREGIAKDGA